MTGDAEPTAADHWKAEYDAQVASFRIQSAAQREKAEKERARWEEIRAEEAKEARSHAPLKPQGAAAPSELEDDGHVAGHDTWESVQGSMSASTSAAPGPSSPSPADARDLVAGETPRLPPPTSPSSQPSPPGAHAQHGSGSEHSGEHSGSDLPSSLTSSFPSDFDSGTPPSPGHLHLHRPGHHHDPAHPSRAPIPAPPALGGAAHAASAQKHEEGAAQRNAPPLALTPMVFAGDLPVRTRLWALAASLAINLLLPFVNGVMLGFGEIVAKEVLSGWSGWRRAGSMVTNIGLGSARSAKAKAKRD